MECEWYWCYDCENFDPITGEMCKWCIGGFEVWDDEEEVEPECPCCGSLEVAP